MLTKNDSTIETSERIPELLTAASSQDDYLLDFNYPAFIENSIPSVFIKTFCKYEAVPMVIKSLFDKYLNYYLQLTGRDMPKIIKKAYQFLTEHYSLGDNIFLMGFSRGALAVRSLAGMINLFGILKEKNKQLIEDAYSLYEARDVRLKENDKNIKEFLQNKQTYSNVTIDFLGVYDTVGSLGFTERTAGNSYKFHDIELNKNIKIAHHALVLDEKRNSFIPSIWKPIFSTLSQQYWFKGDHSDIGGGHADAPPVITEAGTCPHARLSDIPRDWMLREASKAGLRLPESYFPSGINITASGRQDIASNLVLLQDFAGECQSHDLSTQLLYKYHKSTRTTHKESDEKCHTSILSDKKCPTSRLLENKSLVSSSVEDTPLSVTLPNPPINYRNTPEI